MAELYGFDAQKVANMSYPAIAMYANRGTPPKQSNGRTVIFTSREEALKFRDAIQKRNKK